MRSLTYSTSTLSTLRKGTCMGMVLFLMAIPAGCKDSSREDAKSMPPTLRVTPFSLDFGSEQEVQTLSVDNPGQGVLEWEASTDSSWLAMEPAAGQTDSSDTIRVRVGRATLTAGMHEGSLDIRSNGGTEKVLVTVVVVPLLRVEPETLDFGEDRDEIVFHISNDGTGLLEWSLEPSAQWLRAVPTEGKASGEATAVTASIDRAATAPGENKASIEVISSGGDATIPVIAREPPGTTLYLGPTGELGDEAFSQEAQWSKRIAELPVEWTYSFTEDTAIRRMRTHFAISAQEPSEIAVSVSLKRGAREILSRGYNRTVHSIYPVPHEDTLDLSETGARAGDRLILKIASEKDTWLFMGGDPDKNSYLVLE